MPFGCRYVDILITRCSGIGPYQPSGVHDRLAARWYQHPRSWERVLLHESKGCHDPL